MNYTKDNSKKKQIKYNFRIPECHKNISLLLESLTNKYKDYK